MVSYLKKSKIREIVLSLGFLVPTLKDCSYKFYKGSEWLRFSGTDEYYYEVYVCPGYLAIDCIDYDENDVSHSINRWVYVGADYSVLKYKRF